MGVPVGGAVVGGCVGAAVVGAAVVGAAVVAGGEVVGGAVVVVGSPGPVMVPSSTGVPPCEGGFVCGGAVVVSPEEEMHPARSVVTRRMQSIVARSDFMYTMFFNRELKRYPCISAFVPQAPTFHRDLLPQRSSRLPYAALTSLPLF